MFKPAILGVYQGHSGVIRLFAYVVAARTRLTRVRHAMLKLEMLETLFHEIAHHQDWMTRVARGRWLSEAGATAERYAHATARRWTEEYALPRVLATMNVSRAELEGP